MTADGQMTNVIVTGGLGFIGSAVVRQLLATGRHRVLNVDKVTYAATQGSVAGAADSELYSWVRADVADPDAMSALVGEFDPDIILHLAAESHVDRSIDGPAAFIETNVVGTMSLLQAARHHWSSLDGERQDRFRFVQVSTDEVYGSLTPTDPRFTEDSPHRPRSPYSASKAAADHLASAWYHTYGMPVVITNCSNNYGPFQFPEKLIPLMVLRSLDSQPLPVYGKGDNVRDWLFVEDHARALIMAAERGRPGETYVIGGDAERTNLEVVHAICAAIDERRPTGTPRSELIEFVTDRPGHDHRYAIDSAKIAAEFGWAPSVSFEDGIQATIDWYLENESWWRPIVDGTYQLERIGQADG